MVTEYSAGPVAPPVSHGVCTIVDLTSRLLDFKFYLTKTTWSFPRVSQNGFPGVGFRGKQQHCKLQFTEKLSSRNLKYKCLKTEMWMDFKSHWSPLILFHFIINSLLQNQNYMERSTLRSPLPHPWPWPLSSLSSVYGNRNRTHFSSLSSHRRMHTSSLPLFT